MHAEKENMILDGFRAGNKQAFGEVFDLYSSTLIIFARHIVTDASATEDIVADAFVRLYQLRHQINTINNIKAFLFVTVRNGCLNYLRHQKVKEKYQSEQRHSIQAEENAYEHNDSEAHRLKAIYAAVEDLPERRQLIIRMTYIEGFSDDEIADRLTITRATVRQHRCLAIRDLREIINRLNNTNTLV